MLPKKDRNFKQYYGNYRAEIISVDSTIKNGVYKVRVHPFMVDNTEDTLPLATSNLTTRYRHINLKVGDIVWVFFENGDPHYPVIWDICNIKGEYPEADLGTYGNYDKFKFGADGDFSIEYDEQNKKLKIKVDTSTEIDVYSDTVEIKQGSATIKLNGGNVTVTGTNVTIGSVPVPTPGGFCGLPACLFTGAPHNTNTMLGS